MVKRAKKTAGRKAPEKSATLFKVGARRKGNNGKMWIVKTYKNEKLGRRIKRWFKC